MKLRLACADFTFPMLAHNDVLKLIAMLGMDGVDIGLFEGRTHIQPSQVIADLAGSAKDLSRRVADQGLALADVYYQANGGSFYDRAANDPNPAEQARSRDLFLRMLEFTLRCNAKHMSGLPGVDWDGETHEQSLKRAADELSWRAEQARQVGVVYSVEAHVGSVAPTPAAAKALVDLAAGLTLTLDYTHFVRQGFSDAECEALIPYASHYHARGANAQRLQALFKENSIDYAGVLRAMERAHYAGYVGIEYVWTEWERCNEVDNLSETVLMRDHLRSLMA
jgi:sugar phosphate isomerase/epimerase